MMRYMSKCTKYKLKFENGLHQGDYFDFTLSNNVNTHGVSTARKVPEIKNGSVVMATGEVLEGGKIDIHLQMILKIRLM